MHNEDISLEVKEPALLMEFLLQNLKQKSRDNVKSLLRNKQVWIDGRNISQFNHPLKPGQKVLIRWSKPTEVFQDESLNIVYEDDTVVVIDKQAGLLSISTDSEKRETAYSLLRTRVKLQNPANKIFVVHRLDRDTSGLMLFAKTIEAKEFLQKTWLTSVRERTYVAVVEGSVEQDEGEITSYLYESKAMIVYSSRNATKGELAITHYKVIKRNKLYSLLEVNLETGKKNQIRVHMQDMGHPIIGDKKYGAASNPIGRLGLHASVLSFNHPVTGAPLFFKSKTPHKFTRLF